MVCRDFRRQAVSDSGVDAMRTRFAKSLLLGFGVAMALVWLCTLSNREPEYQGKRLSAWFKQYYRTGQRSRQWNEDQHDEAAQALRAMGTNAVPFLLEKLYDYRPDSPARTNVLTFLSRLPEPFRFPPFIPAWGICSEAANAIAEIKPTEEFLLPLVTNRLHSTNQLERDATIHLLCATQYGVGEIMPLLRDMLTSTNWTDQLTGTIRLRQLGLLARPALPELIELVKSDQCDQRVFHAACRALAEFGSEAAEAAPALERRLEHEMRVSSRINFAKTLCRIDARQTNALAELIQYAADSTNAQRGFAIMSLGSVGPNAKAAVPVLLEAVSEDDDRVWNISATALMKIGETNLALSGVAERLTHRDKQTRLNAAMFIVYYEPTHATALSNLFEFTKDPAFARTAIQQLGKLQPAPEFAVSLLREIAANKDAEFRADAETALRRIQTAGASQRQTR
jgi:HEAT repeat protein